MVWDDFLLFVQRSFCTWRIYPFVFFFGPSYDRRPGKKHTCERTPVAGKRPGSIHSYPTYIIWHINCIYLGCGWVSRNLCPFSFSFFVVPANLYGFCFVDAVLC